MFSIQMQPNQNKALVSMNGVLDEDAELQNLNLGPFAEITFDLKNLTRINSRGLRKWLAWTAALDKSKKYFLLNCPKILVSQANMVRGVIPQWIHVKSLELPYFCEHCQMPFSGSIKLGPDESLPEQIETKSPCPQCKKIAELDAEADNYFHFLGDR